MCRTFIEIASSMWINVNIINKIVRNKNGNYFLLLKNKEKYPITNEKAFSLISLGIANA